MIRAVLFDIDGTILDTFEFVFSAVRYTLKKYGFSVSEELILAGAGRSLVEYYKFILPKADYKLLAKTHAEFQKDKQEMVKPFPKVKEVLKKLKKQKIKIVAVSNRMRDSLIKSMENAGIIKYFDAIVSAEDVKNPKPHPEHTLKALELIGIESTSAILVGDTEHDIFSGRDAGVKTVAITSGWAWDEVKKSKPDFVIDKIEDLLQIIKLS